MEAITQALQQAGYEIEATEPNIENVTLTIVKDGIRGRLTVPPNISAYGIVEMVQWAEAKHAQQVGGMDKHEE